jgi:hypothetical protein
MEYQFCGADRFSPAKLVKEKDGDRSVAVFFFDKV